MTRSFLLLLTVRSFCFVAQPALPFPSDNAAWAVDIVSFGNPAPHRIYATMGDSTFNGWTYTKIGWKSITGQPWEATDLNYHGSMRDENGRWLYVPADSTDEYPLFDFSRGVGQIVTIENPFTLFNHGEQEYRVQSITNVQTAQGQRRMWTLVGVDPSGWQIQAVEGIGASSGLFGHALLVTDLAFRLTCMQQNGELTYLHPNITSCPFLSTGVTESTSEPELLIAPNPACDRLTISGKGMDPDKARITVLDALGRSVDEVGIVRSTGMWNIDVSTLPIGLYTVSIATPSHGTMHGRVVVAR